MTAGRKHSPQPAVARGQVWIPNRGVLALEVLSVTRERACVRKFAPDGKYPKNTIGMPFEVEIATRSIRSDYTLQSKEPTHDAT